MDDDEPAVAFRLESYRNLLSSSLQDVICARHWYSRDLDLHKCTSLSLMGTCNCTVDGGRRLMLTRLRPEPVLVPAFRGLLNRTYSARDTMITTSLFLFTLTRANLRGTAFKINQLHLATIATLANFSVDKLTSLCRGVPHGQ